jgi:hypothetical protein
LLAGSARCTASPSSWSIARIWDEETLAAIRIDLPNPPVHARNLFHVSVAMYDAWAAYDPVAVGYLYHRKHTTTDAAAARREAISYAAYRLLIERYSLSRNASNTLAALDARMAALGYDKNDLTTDTSAPRGVGNRVASIVSAFFLNDGSLQTNGYKDLPVSQGGYAAVNPPLITGGYGTLIINPNRWQPLAITNAVSQNNLPADVVQKFLGAQWLAVRPFSLTRDDSSRPWFDPGPPPQLNGVGDAQYRSEVVDVIRRSSQLTPDDGVTLDISPGSFGNNDLGTNDGTGHPLNPVTGLPYEPNLVKRGDFARALAEFWADGPNSETPPGHWNVIGNSISDDPSLVKRLGGSGPELDGLEWDAKMYFALNSAVHDAACAAWSLKRYYDGWRPIEAIRAQGQLGQSSDPGGPSYHPNGLPLVPGLIEVATPETTQPGGRHAGLTNGAVVIFAWPGQPAEPLNQYSGVRWIAAPEWLPYQKKTFVTPAFPGYNSGHSTFSRAAAEVLAAMTGSAFFPAGLGSYTISTLAFEQGPTRPVRLEWGTYFDASDQAGLSRLWGGIHVSVDDLTGRRIGSECGKLAWALARQYFDGSILYQSPVLTIRQIASGGCEIRYDSVRGLFYQLQSTADLDQPFQNDPAGPIQALNTPVLLTDLPTTPRKFYRLVESFGNQ